MESELQRIRHLSSDVAKDVLLGWLHLYDLPSHRRSHASRQQQIGFVSSKLTGRLEGFRLVKVFCQQS